ncbi:MAG: hypothetical protein AAF919_15650 [Pseudomonadota bacterium]
MVAYRPKPSTPSRFLREEAAAVSVEAVLMIPVLVIFFIGFFTFFDAYRRQSTIEKASYAIADVLSRYEGTTTVGDFDIRGLRSIFTFLTFAETRNYIRVTEIQRNGNTLDKIWSHSTDGQPIMTDARLEGYKDQIPTLDDEERLIIVETFSIYEPPFNVGIEPRIFETFVATKPRYATRLICDNTIPDCPP